MSKKTTIEPMEEIKRLMVFQLYRSGATTKEIGKVLNVSYKTIERMIPLKRGKA
ncbi:MAG: helix-turn-helix domain-containing protein [Patescibacteria group bacterium]|jgi:DNA-directed RNA polymerase specialized sigma subunit